VCYVNNGNISQVQKIYLISSTDVICGIRKNEATKPFADKSFNYGFDLLFPYFYDMSQHIKFTINFIFTVAISVLISVLGFIIYSRLKKCFAKNSSNNINRVNPMPSAPEQYQNTVIGVV